MPQSQISSRCLTPLRRLLLRWFAHHQRDLPWRHNRNPYRIWVSEVMLQQTTVAAVIPRFERFLDSFPTIRHLAQSDEQEVLRCWEGLGYYRRARDLHRAAQSLVANHAKKLPDDSEVWRRLPGVGRYILGAVLSQAFDRRMPIVEANSKRVLCRLFGQKGDPKSPAVDKWLWRTAEAILPRKRCGDFNQAIMELGALVCTPVAPKCEVCPLASLCVAKKKKLQATIPTKSVPPQTEQVKEVAVVIRKGSKVLLVCRPETGRWANMWEFPHATLEKEDTHELAAHRLLSRTVGIKAIVGDELLRIRHSVTRFRIDMVCFEAEYRSGSFDFTYYKDARWLEPMELKGYPVSTPQRHLADILARTPRQRRLF
jgi:A/G-specific adenine glycosylase